MKGNIEVHWEIPGKFVRDCRTSHKEVFTENEESEAKAKYKELKAKRFIFNLRLMRVERYTAEGKPE